MGKGTKKRVLVDVELVVEVYTSHWYGMDRSVYLNNRRDDLQTVVDIIKDHKSMSIVSAHVQDIWEERCSFCESEWEVGIAEEGDGTNLPLGTRYCAHCEAEVE